MWNSMEGRELSRLFVNGKRRQVLATREVFVITPAQRVETLVDEAPFRPVIYDKGAKMSYVPTLFFPLQKAGKFQSTVTNLRVSALK